jgi:acetoin utilization protein AcuC
MREPPRQQAVFLYADCFRDRAYGRNHPLAIPRVALTLDLIRAYGAIDAHEIVAARPASDAELLGFHTAEYVAALRAVEARGGADAADRERHALGTMENPYFERMFATPATAGGASVQAAHAVLAGRMAFNPAGGMHHARPDRAAGFCFVNDVVLAIQALRAAGQRVLYVDIDAHHGDAVEAAFVHDPDTFTLSLHMDTAYAFPGQGGRFEDASAPGAAYATMNLPLPAGTCDAEYAHVFGIAWRAVLQRFVPDCVVLQAGADAIAADPLGRLALTTQGFLGCVRTVIEESPRAADGTPRLMVTGGGGYHPLVVARAWTGIWGLLSGRDLPATIPAAGRALLAAVTWDLDDDEDHAALLASRLDPPRSQEMRPEIAALASRIAMHPCLVHA